MKIQTLLCAIALALPLFADLPACAAAQQVVVGPQYSLVQQKSDYQHKENLYCGNYFVLEGKTQYGGPYLKFYYRDDKNAVAFEEAPLTDVSFGVIPSVGATAPPGELKVTRLGTDDKGQAEWRLSITQEMLETYAPCLKDVPRH